MGLTPHPITMPQVQATILREGPEWKQGNEDYDQPNPALRCFHEATECLGSGGSIVYRRCKRCGDVVLVQAGRAIVIPSR